MKILLDHLLQVEGVTTIEILDNESHYIVFLIYEGCKYELTLFSRGKAE